MRHIIRILPALLIVSHISTAQAGPWDAPSKPVLKSGPSKPVLKGGATKPAATVTKPSWPRTPAQKPSGGIICIHGGCTIPPKPAPKPQRKTCTVKMIQKNTLNCGTECGSVTDQDHIVQNTICKGTGTGPKEDPQPLNPPAPTPTTRRVNSCHATYELGLMIRINGTQTPTSINQLDADFADFHTAHVTFSIVESPSGNITSETHDYTLGFHHGHYQDVVQSVQQAINNRKSSYLPYNGMGPNPNLPASTSCSFTIQTKCVSGIPAEFCNSYH